MKLSEYLISFPASSSSHLVFVFVASLLLLDDEKEPGDPGVLRISLLLGFSIAILFWVGASLFDLTDRIECAVYFLVALPVAWLAIRVLENFAGELTSFHIVAGHEVAYVAIVLSRGEELSFGFYSGVKSVVPLAIVVAMVALACLVVPGGRTLLRVPSDNSQLKAMGGLLRVMGLTSYLIENSRSWLILWRGRKTRQSLKTWASRLVAFQLSKVALSRSWGFRIINS